MEGANFRSKILLTRITGNQMPSVRPSANYRRRDYARISLSARETFIPPFRGGCLTRLVNSARESVNEYYRIFWFSSLHLCWLGGRSLAISACLRGRASRNSHLSRDRAGRVARGWRAGNCNQSEISLNCRSSAADDAEYTTRSKISPEPANRTEPCIIISFINSLQNRDGFDVGARSASSFAAGISFLSARHFRRNSGLALWRGELRSSPVYPDFISAANHSAAPRLAKREPRARMSRRVVPLRQSDERLLCAESRIIFLWF